ncbi:hypothetical protein U1Q18_008135 [Sarracenia purpurea var. burkii]
MLNRSTSCESFSFHGFKVIILCDLLFPNSMSLEFLHLVAKITYGPRGGFRVWKPYHETLPGKITRLRLPPPFQIAVVSPTVSPASEPRIKERTVLGVRSEWVGFVPNPFAGRVIADSRRRFLISFGEDMGEETNTQKRLRLEREAYVEEGDGDDEKREKG